MTPDMLGFGICFLQEANPEVTEIQVFSLWLAAFLRNAWLLGSGLSQKCTHQRQVVKIKRHTHTKKLGSPCCTVIIYRYNLSPKVSEKPAFFFQWSNNQLGVGWIWLESGTVLSSILRGRGLCRSIWEFSNFWERKMGPSTILVAGIWHTNWLTCHISSNHKSLCRESLLGN